MSIVDINTIEDHERFRAELASIRPDGRRKWIYARKPRGRYTNWRTVLSVFLMAFFLLAPYVKINGHQFMLLNIIERKFVFFGMPFWPSDFYLVALMFVTTIVTFVIATASLGRIWCGWLCPQTVFMEMVFRKIEWLIEGSPVEQAKRHAGPWNRDRIVRAGAKVLLFSAMSFVIANTFLSYVISSDVLLRYVADGPLAHLELFLGLIFFTFVFFMVFYRYREQACLIACPYGRYMSTLVDERTVTVSYDHLRGEGRSKWSRQDVAAQKKSSAEGEKFSRPSGSGDCLDCHQCVTVCPTGIDIRNGIQLECVGCTACIDACDEVMDKVGLDRGLIRYASLNSIRTRSRTGLLTRRIVAYGVVWIILMSTVVTLLAMRSSLDVVILRQAGTTWVMTTDGLANFYQIRLINKTSADMPINVRVRQPHGMILQPLGLPTSLKPEEIVTARFILTQQSRSDEDDDEQDRMQGAEQVVIDVETPDGVQSFKTSFVGP
ncbi:MAG: cytochrome c oxidase accessory protein CcoG [Candidatus Kapabacteria bacterium]|nr:cytochrome c oxidase accessory protein CcoG [Candidatus Kapabacteria bacterium]